MDSIPKLRGREHENMCVEGEPQGEECIFKRNVGQLEGAVWPVCMSAMAFMPLHIAC